MKKKLVFKALPHPELDFSQMSPVRLAEEVGTGSLIILVAKK